VRSHSLNITGFSLNKNANDANNANRNKELKVLSTFTFFLFTICFYIIQVLMHKSQLVKARPILRNKTAINNLTSQAYYRGFFIFKNEKETGAFQSPKTE
jgi:hypothetical protein